MVSVSTARQRPHPLLAGLAAAVAGMALALTGSAPAGAEPPGAPVAVPSLAPDSAPGPLRAPAAMARPRVGAGGRCAVFACGDPTGHTG